MIRQCLLATVALSAASFVSSADATDGPHAYCWSVRQDNTGQMTFLSGEFPANAGGSYQQTFSSYVTRAYGGAELESQCRVFGTLNDAGYAKQEHMSRVHGGGGRVFSIAWRPSH